MSFRSALQTHAAGNARIFCRLSPEMKNCIVVVAAAPAISQSGENSSPETGVLMRTVTTLGFYESVSADFKC